MRISRSAAGDVFGSYVAGGRSQTQTEGPPGSVRISDLVWTLTTPVQNGVLVSKGYLETPYVLWCTNPEPGRDPFTGATRGPILASHPQFGARAFGQTDSVAGPGVYLTRERFIDSGIDSIPSAPSVLFRDCRDRALSYCPFLGHDRKTHGEQGGAVAYGDTSATLLSFTTYEHTNQLGVVLSWLDSRGEELDRY